MNRAFSLKGHGFSRATQASMNSGLQPLRVSEKRTASSEEQILLPLRIRPSHQSHDVAARMQVKRTRLAVQPHVALVRHHIALPAIAVVAAGDEVFPGRSSAA